MGAGCVGDSHLPSQERSVDSDDSCAAPHDHEDSSEHECCLVFLRTPAQSSACMDRDTVRDEDMAQHGMGCSLCFHP